MLPKVRLNYGVCAFKIDGKDKILLIGGNISNFRNYGSYRSHLYSDCLLYHVDDGYFEEDDFDLSLSSPKDCTTALVLDDKYVYSFFGRTLKITNEDDFLRSNSKYYEYCKNIERWEINSQGGDFTNLKIKFDEKVEKILKPLVIPQDNNSFLIVGGVRGNQTP
mmetsp:Transcript_4840/g.4585  ORF Transcript_4840/g.4585 Transcript_4840/m.4585 type:complete len:164 (+) Transcript_4840:350-841(+)